jgi:glycosyltransferase involved in cell wall biosynthesis
MLSIGILTYNSPNTLDHTLKSYTTSGLLNITDDILCIIQNSKRQTDEINVCNKYNIRSIVLPDNGNMASGFKSIYDNAKYDNILFLENDFCTYCSNDDVINYIENSLYFINNNIADIVRGRSRINAGKPNYGLTLRNIPKDIFINHTHLSECMYWIKNPDIEYPDKIIKIQPKINGKEWYLSTSQHCNYTNNPYICSKKFFKHAIYPYLEFGSNIESKLTDIWKEHDYKCIFGFGIFTHERKYDGRK